MITIEETKEISKNFLIEIIDRELKRTSIFYKKPYCVVNIDEHNIEIFNEVLEGYRFEGWSVTNDLEGKFTITY